MNTKILIFSKDRAPQLLLLLDTMRSCCSDFVEFDTNVLYKTSNSSIESMYQEISRRHSNVTFRKEVDLQVDVCSILKKTDFVFFLVDDCIFVDYFSLHDIVHTLDFNKDCLGFSLRLGKNTVQCYPFNCKQKIPDFVMIDDYKRKFDWTISEYDFGYPLELSSSVYRTEDIFRILKNVGFNSVNHFESVLAANMNLFRLEKPNLLCFDRSKAFCNPLNIVGSIKTNKNRHSDRKDQSISFLNDKFLDGWKIAPNEFIGYIPNGCHQEVEISWSGR